MRLMEYVLASLLFCVGILAVVHTQRQLFNTVQALSKIIQADIVSETSRPQLHRGMH